MRLCRRLRPTATPPMHMRACRRLCRRGPMVVVAPPIDERTSRQRFVWKSSPRWATVKGEANAPAVKQASQTKFKDAQAKAAEVGVENLTGEDIAGLTPAQIKQLRGY